MHKCKDIHHFICTFSHLHICTLLSIVNAKCADAQMQRYASFHLHIFTFAHLHIVKHLLIIRGIHLRLVLLQDTASIVATEAESIAEGCAYGALLCLIEGEVEVVVDILIAIVLIVVDCRRYDVVLY